MGFGNDFKFVLSYFFCLTESNILKIMESNYHPHPYHNAIHAADVVHSINFLLLQSQHSAKYTDMEKLAAILAAVGHDLDHPVIIL